MYTGFYMPDGGIPPESVINNKNVHQDVERNWMNNASYQMYLYRLMDYAISVFEWHDLPEGVDERMMEYWLLQNGMVVFFKDDMLAGTSVSEEGYAVLPAMINGEWNIYNYPVDRRAYATDGYNKELTDEDSVLIFNDYLRVPMMPSLMLYAKRLAELDRTIDINVINQKAPKILRGNEQNKLTALNMMKQIEENRLWLWTYKDSQNFEMEVLDLTVPFVAKDLQTVKHQIWNEALTYIGVENVNTEKKERLISDEVMSNMGDVEVSRFTRLNAREQACDKINEMFGLDVSVTFRSGTYVKAEGYGSQPIPVEGMQSGSAGNEGAGYPEEGEGGVVAKIRKVLGI